MIRNILVLSLFATTLGLHGCGGGGGAAPPPPDFSILASSVTEGNTGISDLTMTMRLSTVSTIDTTVDYATSDDTATAGLDYTASTGTLTIPAGALTGSVNIEIAGDVLMEIDETFTVTLSNPVNATLATTSAVMTILDNDRPTPPESVVLNISGKSLDFGWMGGANVDHYRILVNPTGLSGFTVDPAATNIVNTATSQSIEIPVHKTNWVGALYMVEACDVAEIFCVASSEQALTAIDSIAATIYAKASNTEGLDSFGDAVAISSDGLTLAVSASGEDSAAVGIDGDQTSNIASNSGAVYVFTKNGTTWSQQAYIKASNSGVSDFFGASLSFSDDGNTLAVAAFDEDSVATGIGGNQADNTASDSGAVYVFSRTGAVWSQQAYVKASNTQAFDQFGISVALSGDGLTLAVSSNREDSSASGINGNEASNTASNAGAVYVFVKSGAVWSQQAYIKASNTQAFDLFGQSVSLNTNGNTLVVGAIGEDGAATGINGNQADNTGGSSGAVYVFTRSGVAWTQQAYVKASNTGLSDSFGQSVSVSADGNTLAVGAHSERSAATGINGDQTDNTASAAGAVYVFSRLGVAWSQQAYIKASNSETADFFGQFLAISDDGDTLAVAAPGEDSIATGIDGDQLDNTVTTSGAVYVFSRSFGFWSQKSYVKSSNNEMSDLYGRSVSLNADGTSLVVGANSEDSIATGIDGDQADNTAINAGAVFLY